MKIFHNENERTVVYVQMQDIMYILNFIREIYALKHNKTHMPFSDFVNN